MIKIFGLDYTYYDHPNMYSLVLYSWWCNLRCYGCHNRQLAGWLYKTADKESKQDIKISDYTTPLCDEDISLAIKNEMLDMIILCGWEFLIHPMDQIKETILQIKQLNPKVLIRIDTNGTFPDKVKELAEWWEIDWFAIDIKWPYWDSSYYGDIKDVIWIPIEVAKKIYPKMVESLEYAKQLPYTIYRTVVYPNIKDDSYFGEIKSYVSSNLKKPHYFSNFVNL